ncbi:MAG: magnesium transporter, partial [Mesorhizobium sp.]|nr:magnesium transporter [Mesorhizobium sp.]
MDQVREFKPATAGVIACGAYASGRRVADIAIEEAGEWAAKDGHVVWIGLLEPSGDLLARVQAQFHLHDLAIEDAEHPHQRPKLEQYGEALFIVARTAQLIDRRVTFGETHLFVGKGYIVSVRHGPSTSYTAVRQHWESCPHALAKGEDFVLYAILDFIVDNYMPVLEQIEDEVEEIEDKVLVKPMSPSDIERLYMLRRDLLRLRNAALPLVEVCRRLTSAELPQIQPGMHPLFRDVTDHIRTVQEKIDSLREVLAFAFEASLLVGQS